MPKNIEIIFENDDMAVVNKPVGVSVTADRGGAEDLLMILNKQLTLTEPLRLIHRLDKETSGILMIAKNKAAQSRYSRLFAKRTVQKLYLAIVRGPLPYEGGSIKDPIARSKRNPQAMHVHPRLGKPSHTVWKQLADFGELSLVCAQLITGRTHQIRIHFAHRGMPLAIDPIYGSTDPLMLSAFKTGYKSKFEKDEPPVIDRLTLHAYQLTIPVGPEENEDIRTFTAPLDKKFAAAIKLLARHTAKSAPGFKQEKDMQRILKAEPLDYPLQEDSSKHRGRPVGQILMDAEHIEQTVTALAHRLNEEYISKEPVVAIVLLEGAKRFADNLFRELVFTLQVEYLKVSSYFDSTVSTGTVKIEGIDCLEDNLKGRHVLIVDDIYDTGKTLSCVLETLTPLNPKSIKTCVLLEKAVQHEMPVKIDFTGASIEDKFVIGYGLDYNGQYRDLPYIAALNDPGL